MSKNDTGEFELVLGNKQLLSGFAVVMILLGVFLAMGYIIGRNSVPSSRSGAPGTELSRGAIAQVGDGGGARPGCAGSGGAGGGRARGGGGEFRNSARRPEHRGGVILRCRDRRSLNGPARDLYIRKILVSS